MTNLSKKKSLVLNQCIFPQSTNISKKGELIIGGCNSLTLAAKYGTPLYIIDEMTFRNSSLEYINCLKKYYSDFLVLYAAKAFACKAIFKISNNLGLGLDIVSGGEIHLALKSSFNKKNIYFHGNNKSPEEIELAIKNNLGRRSEEHTSEL